MSVKNADSLIGRKNSLFPGKLKHYSALRFPELSIRTEKYLLPAVTTGPMDPEWSPNSQWIAFSMRGDIWKVSPEGGTAIALTQGPDYYFEPAWSPDGTSIAFVADNGDNLTIGVINENGNGKKLLVTDSKINIEPVWSSDGKSIYFVSDRSNRKGIRRGLHIYKIDLESNTITPVVVQRGNQVHPSISPDGKSLAYVSHNNGIWIKPLSNGKAKEILHERMRDRAAPVWRPDGKAIAYVSELRGNDGIVIIPSDGGSKIWLTRDKADEMAPAISCDGQLAFVSNRKGYSTLFTLPLSGGTTSNWHKVDITSEKAKQPEGNVIIRIKGEDGKRMAATIYLKASDGRSYAPEHGFRRVDDADQQPYFFTLGIDTVRVPAGATHIEALRGFEYLPAKKDVEVLANGTVEITLEPEHFVHPIEKGWYSSDAHAHDLHKGRYGLSHKDFYRQVLGEDINFTNASIHMDGTRIMGRWTDLTGKPSPLSTKNHILQYGEEFRGSRGHIIMVGIHRFILPFVGGERGTAYASPVLNADVIDSVVAQGGLAGFPHPYSRPVKTPEDGAFSEIPMDVAFGKGSFYDVLCIPYDAFVNADMYYRLLNSGFEIAATGGSDTFSDVWRDQPIGTDRAYTLIKGSFSIQKWMEAVKAGHTFATNGPLLFVKVNGKVPGSEIHLTGNQPATLQVSGEVASIAPLLKVDVLLNGEVIKSIDAKNKAHRFKFSVPVQVKKNGWIAVRTYGLPNKYVMDVYPFAQTTPVYILRNGKRYTSPKDAQFLHDVVEAEWQSVKKRAHWNSKADMEHYRKAVKKAERVYEKIKNGTYTFKK